MRPTATLLALFLAVMNANGSFSQSNENDPYKDYSHYEIKVTLDVANRKLVGSEKVRLINTFSEPLDSLYFVALSFFDEKNPYVHAIVNDLGFVHEFEPNGTKIKAVADGEGNALEYRFVPLTTYLRIQKYSNGQVLFYVKLNKLVLPGEEALLKIDFEVKLPNVYSVVLGVNGVPERWSYKDLFAARNGWYPVELNRSERQWDFERFTARGHFVDKLEFTLPRNYVALVAGDHVVETIHGEIKTVTVTDDHPVVTKTIGAAPNYQVISSSTEDGVQINVYYLPEAEKKQAQYILESCVEIVERYNRLYGMTDYKRIVVVNGPFHGGPGGASDGAILLDDGVFSTANILAPHYIERGTYHFLAHELGHLWSGVGTTVDFNKENYLSEGLTEFLSYNLVEEKFPGTGNFYNTGHAGLFSYLLVLYGDEYRWYTFRDFIYGPYVRYYRDGWDEPVIAGFEDSNLHVLETKHYSKGYKVFKMLETYVGKEVMLESLREYFARYKHKVAATEDLKAIVEKRSGKNLDRFFDDWLYRAEYTDYSIKHAKNKISEGKHGTEIGIGKKGKGLTPLEVEVVLEGGEKQSVFLEEVTTDTTVTISTPKKVKGVILDPYANILETSRVNNKNIDNLDFYLFGNAKQLIRRKPLENYFLGLYPSLHSQTVNGISEQGLGLKLVGQKHLYHRWQFGGTPLFATEGKFKYSSYRVFGSLALFTGRGKNIFLSAAYEGRGRLDAGLNFYYPHFKIIDIGKYGRFYYPVYTFNAGIFRDDSFTESPIHSAVVGLSYDRLLNHAFIGNINLEGSAKIADFNDFQFIKADAGLTKLFKLAPRLLLAPSLKLGAGDNLPNDRKYKLQDGLMRGYDRIEEGNRFANLSVDVVFPIVFGKKQKLMNLAVFRGIAGGAFLEAGDVWNSNTEVIKAGNFLDDAKLNAGVEFSFLFTTIFDIPIPLTFGYGQNLRSAKEKGMADSGRFYFKLDTPVTLFTTLFGY